MWRNPKFPGDLVTFTEEMLNGKLQCLRNPKLRFGCDFLQNPANLTEFVRWNKPKERAPLEMHFYGIESRKMLRKI